MSFIYRIMCTKNGKSYIGKTERMFEDRYPDGRWWAETHNKMLMDDAFRWGQEFFETEILAETKLIGSDLLALESFFIDRFRTMRPHGYNVVRPKMMIDKLKLEHKAVLKNLVTRREFDNFVAEIKSIMESEREKYATVLRGKLEFAQYALILGIVAQFVGVVASSDKADDCDERDREKVYLQAYRDFWIRGKQAALEHIEEKSELKHLVPVARNFLKVSRSP